MTTASEVFRSARSCIGIKLIAWQVAMKNKIKMRVFVVGMFETQVNTIGKGWSWSYRYLKPNITHELSGWFIVSFIIALCCTPEVRASNIARGGKIMSRCWRWRSYRVNVWRIQTKLPNRLIGHDSNNNTQPVVWRSFRLGLLWSQAKHTWPIFFDWTLTENDLDKYWEKNLCYLR